MILASAAVIAWADPQSPPASPDLLRLAQPLAVVHYARVDDRPDRPPIVRGRAKTGPIEAWAWPDGTVARYRRYHGRSVAEDHWFDSSGIPWATVVFGATGPTEVVVATWPAVKVAVADWQPSTLGPAVVRGPGTLVQTEGHAEWTSPEGTLSADWLQGPADPASDAFAAGITEGCGCLLSDRHTALADGSAGVGWTMRAPLPTSPGIGELWVFPRSEGALVLAFTAVEGELDSHPELAPGRAAVTLIAWEKPR